MVSPELKAKVQTQEMGPWFQMQSEGCSHLARYFGDRRGYGAS